jgi:hypothetical protein
MPDLPSQKRRNSSLSFVESPLYRLLMPGFSSSLANTFFLLMQLLLIRLWADSTACGLVKASFGLFFCIVISLHAVKYVNGKNEIIRQNLPECAEYAQNMNKCMDKIYMMKSCLSTAEYK